MPMERRRRKPRRSGLSRILAVLGGVAIVICTVAAAAFCAWRFPIEEDGK